MTVTLEKHVVAFPMQMWGHTRPMCTLVSRLVKLRNVTVTFFTVINFYDRVKTEIERDFSPEEQHLASRIRVIALKGSEVFQDMSMAEKSFEAAWMKSLDDEPLVCARTNTRFPAHPVRPSAVILDMFVPRAFEAIRKLSPDTKVYVWLPIATHCFFHWFGEDRLSFAEAEAVRRGVPFEEVAYELFMSQRSSGKVVVTPCTPPMHAYEYCPQQFPLSPQFAADIIIKVNGICERCDGVITFDAAEYCPEATMAIKSWLAETSRKAYYAGPLIAQTPEDPSRDPRSHKIQTFLDKTLASHGEKSLIYIAFGSMFWPTDPPKLWAVLEVLMEKNIPFVMSSASATTQPPPELLETIAKYENGILTDWVPQQALLQHPATGWFISHGGHNSILESMMAGVPTILWPIDADQSTNAIHLAETLGIAYELIEVRNGIGAGKIYRNGRTPVASIEAVKGEMCDVLERAFGEDGARMRAKLQGMRNTLQAAWKEDGVARREVEAFLDAL